MHNVIIENNGIMVCDSNQDHRYIADTVKKIQRLSPSVSLPAVRIQFMKKLSTIF